MVFIVVCIFILTLLLDYGRTSMQKEYVSFPSVRDGSGASFIDNAVSNGVRLQPRDFLRGFDVLSFESDNPRVRFVSNLFLLLNVKLRIWLWNYLPPHPSFSFTWIFSLLLSPIILYRLILNLSGEKCAGWIGLSIYFISIGFLSGILWLFHPAKPVTNFLTLLCFFLASKIERSEQASTGASGQIVGSFAYMLVVMLISFFTDETAWFLFFIVPVLFPSIFLIEGKKIIFISSYLLLGIGFVIFLIYGVPFLVAPFGFDNFNFFSWMATPDTSPESGSFQFKNVGILTYNFLHNQIDPLNAVNRTAPFSSVTLYSWLIFISLGGYFVFLFSKLSRRKQLVSVRIIAGTAVYMVCQTMLLTKHRVIVSNAWYYGCIFPIFFTLLCSIFLSMRIKGTKWINTFLLLAILLTSGYYSSTAWSNNPDLTYPIALRAWAKRGDPEKLLLMRDQYPHGSGWLSRELQYADPASVKTGFLGLIEKCAYRIGTRCRDDNLLARFDTLVLGSSHNSSLDTVYSLIDNNPDTYWHISIDKIGKPAWVIADFGEGDEKMTTSLAARPREGIPWQFFERMTLLGSNNREEWYPLTQINTESLPEDNKWRRWDFSNTTAYRYYKFLITEKYFCSIAELALFEEADKLYTIH